MSIVKLICSLTILVQALFETSNGWELRGGTTARALVDDDDDSQSAVVLIASENFEGCIEPKDGNTNQDKVYLEECDEDSGGWLVEARDGGLLAFRNRSDPSTCLQASYGSPLEDGSKMRLLECDVDNPYQTFLWPNQNGPLKSGLRCNMCAVFCGVEAHVGADPIILKDCDSVEEERLGWKSSEVDEQT